MESITKVLMGFILCGGLGSISYFLFNNFRKNPTKLVKEINDKFKNKEVSKITKKQEVIVKQLKLSESASKESQKKINKIIKTAATEVNKILNEDDLSQIDSFIQTEWEDL